MSSIVQLARKPFSKDSTDAFIGSVLCAAIGVVAIVFGAIKIADMELELKELIVGILLVVSFGFQFILASIMLEILSYLKKTHKEK